MYHRLGNRGRRKGRRRRNMKKIRMRRRDLRPAEEVWVSLLG